jgi:hypothetical protein
VRYLELAFWLLLGAVCAAYSQQPPPSGSEANQQQQSKPTSSQEQSPDNQQDSKRPPIIVTGGSRVIIDIAPALQADADSTDSSRDRNDKAANDRKLVEYSRDLDILTAILAAIGTVQLIVFAWQGWQLKRSVDLAKKRDRILERAYMSGGGVQEREKRLLNGVVVLGGLTGKFEFHLNNHGKTPGELMKIAIEFCDSSNIPKSPTYKPEPFQDWIGPGTQSRAMKSKEIPKGMTAVYGRVYYRDIFNLEHSSGFIQSLESDGGTWPLHAPEAYTSYD